MVDNKKTVKVRRTEVLDSLFNKLSCERNHRAERFSVVILLYCITTETVRSVTHYFDPIFLPKASVHLIVHFSDVSR